MDGFIKVIESIGLVGVLTVIGGLFALGFFIDKAYKGIMGYFNGYHNKKKEEEKISKNFTKLFKKIDNLSYQVKDLKDQIDGIKKQIAENERKNTENDAAILRDCIIQRCDKYKEIKVISALDKENLSKMFNSYLNNCHANGLLEGLYEEFKTWEVEI